MTLLYFYMYFIIFTYFLLPYKLLILDIFLLFNFSVSIIDIKKYINIKNLLFYKLHYFINYETIFHKNFCKLKVHNFIIYYEIMI